MILHAFPDLQWLKKEAESNFGSGKNAAGMPLGNKGWPTVVLNVNTANIHRDNIKGPLSIFTNVSGESFVEADRRRVKVKDNFYFVTNSGQFYTLDIERQPSETLNIHFGQHFAKEVYSSIVQSCENMLEGNEHVVDEPCFHNRLYHRTELFNALLVQIKACTDDSLLLEQKLVELITILINEHNDDKRIKERIPSIKKSTREEITKRLLIALDYVHSQYEQPISIEDLAALTCLSKFHFLRLFKIAFRTTPHQFLNEVRVNRAKLLLSNSELSINKVASETGFRNASSFSRMFQHQTGMYPSQFRQLQ